MSRVAIGRVRLALLVTIVFVLLGVLVRSPGPPATARSGAGHPPVSSSVEPGATGLAWRASGTVAGPGYRLEPLTRQAEGEMRGEGYRLLAPAALPAQSGGSCCCTYMPLVFLSGP